MNPNYSTAHKWYGELLVIMGRTGEGLSELRRALETDPLSLNVNVTLGRYQYHAGHDEEAIEQLRKTIELDSNYPRAHTFLGDAYVQKGMYKEAIAEYKIELSLAQDNQDKSEPLAGLGHVYAVSGNREEAQKILNDLKAASLRGNVSAYHTAMVCAGLGDTDQAFEWLENAYRQHSGWLEFLRIEPRFNRLHSDRRYADLMRRIGLPQ